MTSLLILEPIEKKLYSKTSTYFTTFLIQSMEIILIGSNPLSNVSVCIYFHCY